MNPIIKTCLMAVLAINLGCASKINQPNVLLIVADDLGYADLSCYGSSFYETPNLDKLASKGVRFTDGYASCPVCSPTRASIQTGKHPVTVEITDWIPGRAHYNEPSVRDRWMAAPLKNELSTEETTIANALKRIGYNTFWAGKWHLGETEEYWPEHHGYDTNIAGWKRGGPVRKPKEGYNGYFAPYGNPRIKAKEENEYLPERLTDETIRFIEENKDQPFYACLSYYLVHIPLQALEEKTKKYEEKAANLHLDTVNPFLAEPKWIAYASKEAKGYKERVIQSHAVYAAMIEALDENIGRVLSKLEELGIDDNTIIVFTSDNGGLSTSEGSPTANAPLRGGKGWLYEGGIRVPYIVKYPENKNAGKVSDLPISSIDIMPTILASANLTLKPETSIEGINITPFVETNTIPERALYWHYPHYSNQGGNPGSVIRLGDYKLFHDFETEKTELYNLKEDISERKDLSTELPEKTKELYKKLDDWRTSSNAKMMTPNPRWDKGELKTN